MPTRRSRSDVLRSAVTVVAILDLGAVAALVTAHLTDGGGATPAGAEESVASTTVVPVVVGAPVDVPTTGPEGTWSPPAEAESTTTSTTAPPPATSTTVTTAPPEPTTSTTEAPLETTTTTAAEPTPSTTTPATGEG